MPLPVVDYPLGAISSVAFSPDGKLVALGAFGQVVVYDTLTWKPTAALRKVRDSARSLTFTPDSHRLAVGGGLPSQDGEMLLWDLSQTGSPNSYIGQGDAIESVAFSKDGKQMMLGSDDNTVRYYSDITVKHFVKLDEHNGRVQATAFSPKDNWIFITGAMDRLVKVWDPHTMHTVVNFDNSESGITGLAFLPNGTQFVGSSLDGKLYWWGVNYNSKKQTFSGYLYRVELAHPDGVYSMSISGDGSRLITCGADNTVGIWNAGGGRIRVFKDATTPIYAVALSPDGKTAIGGGRAGVLYIWDVESSRLLNIIAPPALPGSGPRPAQKQTTSHGLTLRK